jgi:hypothetical protein
VYVLYIICVYRCACVCVCVCLCVFERWRATVGVRIFVCVSEGGERELECRPIGNICRLYMTRPNEETEALKACHTHTIKQCMACFGL